MTLEALTEKKKGGERDQWMGCDSEGGLFLLCCLTWGDVENRRDRVRWNDGCYKEPGRRGELRVQFTAGLALKGVGSFSYVITEEKGDRMDGTQIRRQPQRQEVRGVLSECWSPLEQ